jgi:hypothetical protein
MRRNEVCGRPEARPVNQSKRGERRVLDGQQQLKHEAQRQPSLSWSRPPKSKPENPARPRI